MSVGFGAGVGVGAAAVFAAGFAGVFAGAFCGALAGGFCACARAGGLAAARSAATRIRIVVSCRTLTASPRRELNAFPSKVDARVHTVGTRFERRAPEAAWVRSEERRVGK